MKRLTYQESDGRFGVVGMKAGNEDKKLYACVCKLKDYENTGLSPDEIEKLNDFSQSQCAKLLAERDAAVEDITNCCDTCGKDLTRDKCFNPRDGDCTNWKWRGTKGAG